MTTDGIFLARPQQPVDGIPLAVKDLFDTAGLTTTYGSAIYTDHVPERSADAVLALERAGYANVGKTNLHEFAYGITSKNPHYGWVPNPIAAGRNPGGSSGGNAAALAAGLADAALGTDSGGSIRIPAACTGTVGFKPTHGLVPIGGCYPLAPSFDHAGPMARSVRECTGMLCALSDRFAIGPPVADLGDVHVGVAWTQLAEPLVRARVEAAAELFPRRTAIDLPLPEPVIAKAFMREVADVHRDQFAAHRDRYGWELTQKLDWALAVTDAEYERAVAARRAYRDRLADAAADVDLLLTPTMAMVAPRIELDDIEIRGAVIRFTFPFNAVGWPALALPCGPAEHALPASVQLVGWAGEDALVLAAGEALERALA